MASNFFGQIFRITTFGESHGPAIGVVIDGCPAGIPITAAEIDEQLKCRQPGKSSYTSARNEEDKVEILSGVFEGKTTGAPIAMIIRNTDARSATYTSIKDLYRPGHANFTYLEKYGVFDYRGGGRSSGRETAARVAAGAVAKKLLAHLGCACVAFVYEIGGIAIREDRVSTLSDLSQYVNASPIFCPDEVAAEQMMEKIKQVREEGDSLGGILACIADVPSGLGDPVYAKLEALLAAAMLSLPAAKGFEIGQGFAAARMRGSEHNDAFIADPTGRIRTATNHAGGLLGGISTGSPIFFRVAFKPTSSIKKAQQTVTTKAETAIFEMPETMRHDPCVAIRAVAAVEAMTALVLADALLMTKSAKMISP